MGKKTAPTPEPIKKPATVQGEAPAETLEQELERTKIELADTIKANSFLQSEVERLSQQPQTLKPQSPGISAETFELDGKKYGFAMYAVVLPGHGKITATEVLASAELQAQLVEIGSAMIFNKPIANK